MEENFRELVLDNFRYLIKDYNFIVTNAYPNVEYSMNWMVEFTSDKAKIRIWTDGGYFFVDLKSEIRQGEWVSLSAIEISLTGQATNYKLEKGKWNNIISYYAEFLLVNWLFITQLIYDNNYEFKAKELRDLKKWYWESKRNKSIK